MSTSPQPQPPQPQPQPTETPRTQIIIEEAELIRFLKTREGADLITKAYNIPVQEFHNFVNTTRRKDSIKGLMLSNGMFHLLDIPSL